MSFGLGLQGVNEAQEQAVAAAEIPSCPSGASFITGRWELQLQSPAAACAWCPSPHAARGTQCAARNTELLLSSHSVVLFSLKPLPQHELWDSGQPVPLLYPRWLYGSGGGAHRTRGVPAGSAWASAAPLLPAQLPKARLCPRSAKKRICRCMCIEKLTR